MIDFEITANEPFSVLARENGFHQFSEICQAVAQLPYGRNQNRKDFSCTLMEKKGTCSTKHGFLAGIAEENGYGNEIELMVGIFLMTPEHFPQIAPIFENKSYKVIPEAYCYLRYKSERFDFTSSPSFFKKNPPLFVREQRIDPHQAIEWKETIHKDYIRKWLRRNPQIEVEFEEIWQDREKCIQLF